MNNAGLTPDHAIIIVGAGPAGCAAAIQLARLGLASSTLLVDAARFPRHKLCGGGVIPRADALLGWMGVRIEVPAVTIDAVELILPAGRLVRRAPGLFRVVRRDEFDHALLNEAQHRGVMVAQGEPVLSLERASDRIVVVTPSARRSALVVIGADGANSVVRRLLVGLPRRDRFVALEVLTPVEHELPGGDEAPEPPTPPPVHPAVFDFRPAGQGLRGYAWDFPTLVGGRRLVNRGIGGVRDRECAPLARLFAETLERRGLAMSDLALEGSHAPLYDPRLPQSAERVLLAGDAVGIDPWLGEGISVAIGTGMLAARAAAEAIADGDFGFAGHARRIRESSVGSALRQGRAAARSLYRALRRGAPLPAAWWTPTA